MKQPRIINVSRKKVRELPVLWISLATFLIFFLTNLPLLFGIFAVHGGYIWSIWGYAPHQFVFLLAPLPIATFATLAALTIIFSSLSESSNAHYFLKWAGNNWIVIILLGLILSTTVAVFDYYGNPKVFDRFHFEYAQKAADSASEIRARQVANLPETSHLKPLKDSSILFQKIKEGRETMNSDDLLHLDSDTFMLVVRDGELQRRFGILHPVSHLLSELQLTVALFVGFAALFAAALLFLSYSSSGTDLSKATPAVITALSFLAFYPLCFGYWSSEIATLTGSQINNVGYLVVGFLIIVVGLLLVIVDPNIRGTAEVIVKSLPALIGLIGIVTTKLLGIENLRLIIGADANVATRFLVILALLAIGVILCAMLVIQYEESFAQK